MSGEIENRVIMEKGDITLVINLTKIDHSYLAKDIGLRLLKLNTGQFARDKSFKLCNPDQELSLKNSEIRVEIDTGWLEPGLYKFEACDGVTLENETFSYCLDNFDGHGLWHLPRYEVEICGNNREMFIELGCVGSRKIYIISGVLKSKNNPIGELNDPMTISNQRNDILTKKTIKVEISSDFDTSQESQLNCTLEIEHHEKGGVKITNRMDVYIFFKNISFEKIDFGKVYPRERGLKKMPLKQTNSVLGIFEVSLESYAPCFFISYESFKLIDTLKGDDFEDQFSRIKNLPFYIHKGAYPGEVKEVFYLDQARAYIYRESHSKNGRALHHVKPYLNFDLTLLDNISSPITIIIKDKVIDAEGNLQVEWELISNSIDEEPEFTLRRKPFSWHGELTVSLTRERNRQDYNKPGNKFFCLESSCSMIGRISGEECSSAKNEIFKLPVKLKLWPRWEVKWFKDSKIRIFSSALNGNPNEYNLDRLKISNTWSATLTHPTILCLFLFIALGVIFNLLSKPSEMMTCNIFGTEHNATVSVDDSMIGHTPISILVGPGNHIIIQKGGKKWSLPWLEIVKNDGLICLDHIDGKNSK